MSNKFCIAPATQFSAKFFRAKTKVSKIKNAKINVQIRLHNGRLRLKPNSEICAGYSCTIQTVNPKTNGANKIQLTKKKANPSPIESAFVGNFPVAKSFCK